MVLDGIRHFRVFTVLQGIYTPDLPLQGCKLEYHCRVKICLAQKYGPLYFFTHCGVQGHHLAERRGNKLHAFNLVIYGTQLLVKQHFPERIHQVGKL